MPRLIFPFCFSRLERHPSITATYSVFNISRVLARVRIGSPPTGTIESVPLPWHDARPKYKGIVPTTTSIGALLPDGNVVHCT